MTCHAIVIDGVFRGFVCTRGRRPARNVCGCGRTATKLCDGRRGKKGCNRPLCDAHAFSVGGDLDFCAECRALTADPIPDALIAYTDGSGTVSTKPSGAGVVIYDGADVILEASRHLGNGSNNHAEVSAVRIALDITRPFAARPLLVRTDSQYTINALVGPWPHENATNAGVIRATRRLMNGRAVAFEHVPGHAGLRGNERADALASWARLHPPQQRPLPLERTPTP